MRYMRVVAALMFAAVMALGVASCKDSMAPTVLANMGGMDGVAKFLDNWKGAMVADETLNKALSPDDMTMVGRGFANEIAKTAEIPLPNAGVDLVQVLKGKNLPKENLTSMGKTLEAAAATSLLSPEATKGAKGLWNEVVKQVN